MDDFNQIKLTLAEVHFLKKSRQEPIPMESAPRLLRFGLAKEYFIPVKGGLDRRTGKMVITESGNDFLIYRKGRFIEKWVPYWITTGISIVSIILSIIAICLGLQ